MKVHVHRDVKRLTRETQRGVFRAQEVTVGRFVLYPCEIACLVRVTPDATQPSGYLFRPVGKMERTRAPISTWLAFYLIGKPVLWSRALRERLRRRSLSAR